MNSFPLSNVPPIMLERVINKLDGRTYTRLQQTCRDILDFVRSNKNIKGISEFWSTSSDIELVWKYDEYEMRHLRAARKDMESLYGIRCYRLELPRNVVLGIYEDNEIEKMCVVLKKYRISCDKMINQTGFLTKEECQMVFDLVKPVAIAMKSVWSNRWEAVLQLKYLTRLKLLLHPEAAVNATKMLLPKCLSLEIWVTNDGEKEVFYSPEKLYQKFKEIIDYVTLESPSTSFSFTIFFNLLKTQKKIQDIRHMLKELEPAVKSLCGGRISAKLQIHPPNAKLLYSVSPHLEAYDSDFD